MTKHQTVDFRLSFVLSRGDWLLSIWLIALSVLLLLPGTTATAFAFDTRSFQALGFGGLGILAILPTVKSEHARRFIPIQGQLGRIVTQLAGASFFAGFLELCQGFTSRSPSLVDFAVNFVAILVGVAVAIAVFLMPKRISRSEGDISALRFRSAAWLELGAQANMVSHLVGKRQEVRTDPLLSQHHFVFVCGLHASGTTALAKTIATHPEISGFSNTGAWFDEGQHLQSVYPKDETLGGPGLFGLNPDCHITEKSCLVPAAKMNLFGSWAPHWDLTKPILLEKSPSNITRSRFLQEIFPNSSFIFIMRHPIPSLLATLKHNHRASLIKLMSNWVACHRIMFEDIPYLRRSLILRYAEMCGDRDAGISTIANFLGVDSNMDPCLEPGIDQMYFERWRKADYRLWSPPEHWKREVKKWRNLAVIAYIEQFFEREINQFGYSFKIESESNKPRSSTV